MQRLLYNPIDAVEEKPLMAFFTGYFDESGKYQKDKVVSFCGFVNSDWADFVYEWQVLLRRHRIPALHISKDRLRATTSQLKIYASFISLIRQTVECGFAKAIDVVAFNSLNPKVRKIGPKDDPHYWVFHSVVRDVIKYAEVMRDPAVALICDDDEDKACDIYKMYRRMRQNIQQPDNRRILKSIAFGDDNYYPQLQAADLLSWVTRCESLYRFHGIDYSLRALFDQFADRPHGTRIQFTSGLWDSEHLKMVEERSLAAFAKQSKRCDDR